MLLEQPNPCKLTPASSPTNPAAVVKFEGLTDVKGNITAIMPFIIGCIAPGFKTILPDEHHYGIKS